MGSDRRPRSAGRRRHRAPRARRGHQLHRHRRTSTPPASRRRCSARRSPAGGTTSCSPPRSAAAWARGRTRSACRGCTSSQAVEASLKRLGTDYIDLYQIHRFDPLTNIEDTLRALDDLVRAGKVRYIGCSNLPAWQLMKSLAISREQRLERFRCTQSYYSLAGRELEREIDSAAEGSGARAAGLEPAGRRLPLRQVHARQAATRRRAARSSTSRRSTRRRASTSSTCCAPIADGARRDRCRRSRSPGFSRNRRRDERDHRRAED